jgi:hypothetical protein
MGIGLIVENEKSVSRSCSCVAVEGPKWASPRPFINFGPYLKRLNAHGIIAPRYSILVESDAQGSRLHTRSHHDKGAGSRREHDSIQRGEIRPVESTSLSEFQSASESDV